MHFQGNLWAFAMQSLITEIRNQSTLEPAIKLHHGHGRSAARYMGDHILLFHQFMGLEKTVVIIFCLRWWHRSATFYFTPNWGHTTHVVAHEIKHPHLQYGRIQSGKSSIIFPKLSKKTNQSSSCSNHSGSIPLLDYTGPSKVNPPAVACSKGVFLWKHVPGIPVCLLIRRMTWCGSTHYSFTRKKWRNSNCFNGIPKEVFERHEKDLCTYMCRSCMSISKFIRWFVRSSGMTLNDSKVSIPDQESYVQCSPCAVVFERALRYWKPNHLGIWWVFMNTE